MTTWTKNNLAHRRTYLSLRILGETRRSFKKAGDQKVETLRFYVAGASSTVKKANARSLAVTLNNMFIDAFKSKYESDYTQVKSINAMTKVLKEEGKTVFDLAETADRCYDFFGEDV